MPFTPLVDNTGLIYRQALCEQLACIVAVYDGERSDLQAILNACGGGAIMEWVPNKGVPVPAYATGTNGIDFYVWIGGTTAPGELLLQAAGAMTPIKDANGNVVSVWWYTAFQDQWVNTAHLIPPAQPGSRLIIVGDSYGAAVGNHLAEFFAANAGGYTVQLLTFGSPKVHAGGYSGPAPDLHLRMSRPLDPVPVLPPTYEGGIWTSPSSFFIWTLGGKLNWTHLGDGYKLSDDAVITVDDDDTKAKWIAPQNQRLLDVKYHLYSNTFPILAALKDQPGVFTPQGIAVANLGLALLGQGQQQGSLVIPTPTGSQLAQINGVEFGVSNGPLVAGNLSGTQLVTMPAPTVTVSQPATARRVNPMAISIRPPVDANYLRISMFLRAGAFTWTESHIYNAVSGDPEAIPTLVRTNLVTRRMACAASNVEVVAVRSSVINKPKVSRLWGYDNVTLPTLAGTTNLTDDTVCQEFGCAKTTAGPFGRYKGKIFLRGIVDTAFQNNVYLDGNDAGFTTALNAYVAYLVGTSGTVSNWGVLNLSKEDAVAPKVDIVLVTATAGASLVDVTTKQPHLLAVDDVVRISRVPGVTQNIPLNQNWIVKAVTPPNQFSVQLASIAIANFSQQGQGQAQKQIYTFAAYDSESRRFGTTRQTGVRVFQPVGRRKIKRTVGY